MRNSQNISILVIDDDSDIRDTIEMFLKESDLKPFIYTAHNALSGLQLAKAHIPDVIILDLNMPLGSGFDFVSELKHDPKLSKVKILILSGYYTKSNIWESIDKDVDDFLAKPFDVHELEARLLALLKKKAAGSSTI